MTNKVTILTVATHEEGYYKLLKKSAANNGFNLITLAFGQKWEGFSMKYRLYKKYLRNRYIKLLTLLEINKSNTKICF